MSNIEKLQAEKRQLKEKKVTSWAASIKKHHELQIIQERIDYALLGDTVSRQTIQEKLTEIEHLEAEIEQLTAKLNKKKTDLNKYVFGVNIN